MAKKPNTIKEQEAYTRKWKRDRELSEFQRKLLNDTPGAILDCPFCDAAQGEDGPEVMGTHPGTDWVECNKCGASGPHQTGKIQVKGAARRAVDSWNSRRL